jgi:hypothetical protein
MLMGKLTNTMKTVFDGRYFLEKTVNRNILNKNINLQYAAINLGFFTSRLLTVTFIDRVISVSLTGYPTI